MTAAAKNTGGFDTRLKKKKKCSDSQFTPNPLSPKKIKRECHATVFSCLVSISLSTGEKKEGQLTIYGVYIGTLLSDV